MGPTWGQVGSQNFTFFYKIASKRAPGGLRGRFKRVSKKDLNIEASWDRFSVDFGSVLASPEDPKMWPPLRREANFHVFACFKLRALLDPQKPRFWLLFGSQVGPRSRLFWPQEAPGTPKKHHNETYNEKPRYTSVLAAKNTPT